MIGDVTALDLFAGPGGWDTGARDLGIRTLGIEWKSTACETAQAAGHLRYQADIAALDPRDFRGARGQITSAPCESFSTAGKGEGRKASERIIEGVRRCNTAADVEALIATLGPELPNPTTILVLEPLRWALHGVPSWLAWEQVTAVLPLWQACADVLRRVGYSVVTGNVQAEQYGVPQTRKRAVLLARAPWIVREHGPAALPVPTHSRYHVRSPERLDAGVLPWVSMGDALTHALAVEAAGPVTLRSNYGSGGDPSARGERTLDQPAATVTSKAGRNKWVPTFNDQSGTPFDPEWPWKRPATVVAGRGLVQNPGATANRFNGSTKSRNDGVRVTVQEAAVLQSFPADYPWQGTTSAQYQQVGDAVPPLLARALLAAVVPPALRL